MPTAIILIKNYLTVTLIFTTRVRLSLTLTPLTLTPRIRKQLTGGGWSDSFATNIACRQEGASCPKKLETADACFAAAKQVGISGSVHVTTTHGSSLELPSGCTIQRNGTGEAHVFFNTNSNSTVCCGSGVDTIEGLHQGSLITLGLSVSNASGASITMTGPDGTWFAVGFNSHVMANSPYTIVVDGAGKVTEHVLGDHLAGVQLKTSITMVSNTVSNGERTVVMTRPLAGLTSQHHTFAVTQLSMDFISAVGSTPDFSYHKARI